MYVHNMYVCMLKVLRLRVRDFGALMVWVKGGSVVWFKFSYSYFRL